MPDGISIPGGPSFIGLPQPPDVPCDPTGDGWRGPPGPSGPPGIQGPPGTTTVVGGINEAPTDGAVYGRQGSTTGWLAALPLAGNATVVGSVSFSSTIGVTGAATFGSTLQTGADITAGTNTGASARLTLNAPAGNATRNLRWQSAGVNRWSFGPSATAEAATVTTTATAAVAAGLNVIPVASVTGITTGMQISATGIAPSAYVSLISGLNVTTSSNTTGSGIANGATINFVPNTGADLVLNANSDAAGGTWLSPLTITRSTGLFKFNNGINVTSVATRAPVGNAFIPVLNCSANFQGTTTGTAFQDWNAIVINSDIANLGNGGAVGFHVTQNFGGDAAFTGGRVAIQGDLRQVPGATPNAGVSGVTNEARIAGQFSVTAGENAGGTSPAFPNNHGSIYSLATYTNMRGATGGFGGATNYGDCVGINMNMGTDPGTTFGSKSFIHMSCTAGDAVQGTDIDSAILLTAQPNTVGWRHYLQAGLSYGRWPFDPAATIFGTSRGLSDSRSMGVAYGFDFRDVSFSGRAFASPGFDVDGNGNTTSGALVVTTSGNTTILDTTRLHVTNAVVVGGSPTAGWVVGMGMYDTSGNQWIAATVSGGRVATVTLVSPGYTTSPPANPVTVTDQGGLQTAQLTLTWSTTPGLSICPVGQRIGFNNATPIAKPTIAGACAGNTAIKALLTALAAYGLLTDTTSV